MFPEVNRRKVVYTKGNRYPKIIFIDLRRPRIRQETTSFNIPNLKHINDIRAMHNLMENRYN